MVDNGVFYAHILTYEAQTSVVSPGSVRVTCMSQYSRSQFRRKLQGRKQIF